MTYGTPEFYKEHFMDWLADIDAENPQVGEALVDGFILALRDCRDYHAKQVDEYSRIEQRIRKAHSV